MADDSVVQIPKVTELGKDGPIPKSILNRLDIDLGYAQSIAIAIQELSHGLADGGSKELISAQCCAIDALAYRIGRQLEPWTGTGYFGDDEERRVDVPEGQEVEHG